MTGRSLFGQVVCWVVISGSGVAWTVEPPLGPYEYEAKPDHDAFASFNPRKAPEPGPLLLEEGDRLAICGDSITEQKMYSRLMEAYLTACVPQLKVTVRQYGWSGEKTNGFLHRMEKDCLTFSPTVATLAYGMNDSRYRPFDVTNGQWYEDHYTAIVRSFRDQGTRVVVGSPGCAGKIASWVKSRSGNLEQHNINLCALRDIAMRVAEREEVRFADIFWPMYQAQVLAPETHHATEVEPYLVAGDDGIHPGWAGHVIMAWSMLRALGLDGDLGTMTIDLAAGTAETTGGHTVDSLKQGTLTLTSTQYPFCSRGDVDDDNSIRSGLTLVPFDEQLNRLVLRVKTPEVGMYRVTWGDQFQTFSAAELAEGINLAATFRDNPFSDAFEKVLEAVNQKQAYETEQVKRAFHSDAAKKNFAAVVEETEAKRQPLAEAVAASVVPVTHAISVERVAAK
jgi:lysophospholipase L1-like esterase